MVVLDLAAPRAGFESAKDCSTCLSFISAAELRTCFNRHMFIVILCVPGPCALFFRKGAERPCRLPGVAFFFFPASAIVYNNLQVVA